jgi:hypothetical protein
MIFMTKAFAGHLGIRNEDKEKQKSIPFLPVALPIYTFDRHSSQALQRFFLNFYEEKKPLFLFHTICTPRSPNAGSQPLQYWMFLRP